MFKVILLRKFGKFPREILWPIIRDHLLRYAVSGKDGTHVFNNTTCGFRAQLTDLYISGKIVYDQEIVSIFPHKQVTCNFLPWKLWKNCWLQWLGMCLQHSTQVDTRCSNCLLRPGHHTDCKALLRHLVIPWCPVWWLRCLGVGRKELKFYYYTSKCPVKLSVQKILRNKARVYLAHCACQAILIYSTSLSVGKLHLHLVSALPP